MRRDSEVDLTPTHEQGRRPSRFLRQDRGEADSRVSLANRPVGTTLAPRRGQRGARLMFNGSDPKRTNGIAGSLTVHVHKGGPFVTATPTALTARSVVDALIDCGATHVSGCRTLSRLSVRNAAR